MSIFNKGIPTLISGLVRDVKMKSLVAGANGLRNGGLALTIVGTCLKLGS
jgi:hypothetical protein